MPMKYENFSAYTTKGIGADAVHLPLTREAYADLLALLKENEDYIFLALVGGNEYEVVKTRNVSGVLVMERGMENTATQPHHLGTCVQSISPLFIAVMKDLICNYDCCEKSMDKPSDIL